MGGLVLMGRSPTIPDHLHGRGPSYNQELRPTEALVLNVARRTLDIPEDGWVCMGRRSHSRQMGSMEGSRGSLGNGERPEIVALLVCVDAMSGWRYDLRT